MAPLPGLECRDSREEFSHGRFIQQSAAPGKTGNVAYRAVAVLVSTGSVI